MIPGASNISNQVPSLKPTWPREGIPVSFKEDMSLFVARITKESDSLGHVGTLRLEGPLEAL